MLNIILNLGALKIKGLHGVKSVEKRVKKAKKGGKNTVKFREVLLYENLPNLLYLG
jgi:hypothetical protein